MPPGPSVSITLFEAVTYLRGQSASLDARGNARDNRRSAAAFLNNSSPPSQLRGLITINIPKTTRIKSVELLLTGTGRTEWPEGIGNNRIELAEVNELFKQQVTLFDARVENAQGLPLRRANSVGPGIELGDDVDWGMVETQPKQKHGQSSHVSSSNAGHDKEGPSNLARSVGKAAAKAGTAILPPTLMRDLTNNRQPPHKRPNMDHRSSSRSSSRDPRGMDSASSSTPASPVNARFQPQQPPPPMYQPYSDPALSTVHSHGAASSASASAMAWNPSSTAAQETDSILPGNNVSASSNILPPQSVSAAGPHGRSILHPPRSREGPFSRSPESAASEQRGRSRIAGEQVVHFDPKDVPQIPPYQGSQGRAASPETYRKPSIQLTRRRGSSGSSIATPLNCSSSVPPPINRMPERSPSAPGSRRASIDLLGAPNPFAGMSISTKGKGKDKTGSESLPKNNSHTKLSSLKGMLGGLRKEEGASGTKKEDRGSDHTAANGRSTSVHTPHQPPQFHQPPSDWQEFKKGVYTYSLSMPLPANLPPTIHADFGSNFYTLKALVRRSGPLTPNLTAEKEVILVHAPDEEGVEETDAVVVERTWEDSLSYRIFVSGRSFACGQNIPVWTRFVPLGEKIRVWRISAVLEEKTHYYAKKRKVARHETPRRWNLLKLVEPEGKPLLPITSNSANALRTSPLAPYAISAAGYHMPATDDAQAQASNMESFVRSALASSSASMISVDELPGEEARQDALASLLDAAGPWELNMDLQIPGKDSKVNISTDHSKSSITITHLLRLTFRVEKVDNVKPGGGGGGGVANGFPTSSGAAASSSSSSSSSGSGSGPMSGAHNATTSASTAPASSTMAAAQSRGKLFDIVIEAPMTINHSHTANAWLSLPSYWSVANTQPEIPQPAVGGLRTPSANEVNGKGKDRARKSGNSSSRNASPFSTPAVTPSLRTPTARSSGGGAAGEVDEADDYFWAGHGQSQSPSDESGRGTHPQSQLHTTSARVSPTMSLHHSSRTLSPSVPPGSRSASASATTTSPTMTLGIISSGSASNNNNATALRQAADEWLALSLNPVPEGAESSHLGGVGVGSGGGGGGVDYSADTSHGSATTTTTTMMMGNGELAGEDHGEEVEEEPPPYRPHPPSLVPIAHLQSR